jgi:hypothetical protein
MEAIFALGFLQPALTKQISASRYLSCYLSQGWTNPRDYPKIRLVLDENLNFGTPAERTSKQPGRARHATIASTLSAGAAEA